MKGKREDRGRRGGKAGKGGRGRMEEGEGRSETGNIKASFPSAERSRAQGSFLRWEKPPGLGLLRGF